MKKVNADFDLGDLLFAIPEEVENLHLPDPNLLEYYKNLQERTIWIDKDISESLLNEIRLILRWNREDEKANIPVENRKKITVLLFSYGGTLDTCFTFLDIVAMSKTPVVTVNAGVAMSAALLMLLSGKERYCLSKSQALIHQGSGSVGGSFSETEAAMDNYKELIEMMKDYILTHTTIDVKTYNKHKTKDWYLNATEQIKYGIVDGIVEDISLLF